MSSPVARGPGPASPGEVAMTRSARRLCPAGVHLNSASTALKSPCARCAAMEALDDAVAFVAEQLPGLTALAVRDFVASVARTGNACRQLAGRLRSHPDALHSGNSDVDAVVCRLVDALVDGGIEGVVLLRCVVCARPRRRLQLVVPGGRVCCDCYQRQRPETCRECGRTARVATRDDTGSAICVTCRANDASTWQECSRCGQLAQVIVRIDGRPIGR